MRRPLLLLLALSACGQAPCPDPTYDGKGSDESWRAMTDGEARAKKDDAKAIKLTAPAEAMMLAASPILTFVWSTPLTASSTRLPPRSPSMLSRAGQLLYGSAWAHLPPVTGPVHLLRITVPSRKCPVEVLTTRSEWTPDADTWALLKGKSVTLDVFSAYLQDNRISEGPYHFTQPRTFSVAP